MRILGGPKHAGIGKAKHSVSKFVRAPTGQSTEASKRVQAPVRLCTWFLKMPAAGEGRHNLRFIQQSKR